MYVFQVGFSAPVTEYTNIPASSGTITENLPNGAMVLFSSG
jgi:hypothetical protein